MDGVGQGPKVVFEIFGWHCTETVVMGWLVIAIVFVLCKVLTSSLKKVPDTKRQVIADGLEKACYDMPSSYYDFFPILYLFLYL